MKRFTLLSIAVALLFASLALNACGSAPAPTAAPAQPTAAPAQPTAAPADAAQPTAAPALAQPTVDTSKITGLGVSRDQMQLSFSDYTFGDVTTKAGIEQASGQNNKICVGSVCSVVVVSGPADNVFLVSILVPTDPKDKDVTTANVKVLTDFAAAYDNNDADFPTQTLNAILDAQANKKEINKQITVLNGYDLGLDYTPDNNAAMLNLMKH